VRFTDNDAGDRFLALEVAPWTASAPLYPASVRTALDALMVHRATEPLGRRMMLWYGEPGTGKTTAVRALVHAWRDWADATVVADPDRLLSEGKYLRRTVLNGADDERWKLFVLEDTEALLAKRAHGNGFAKLLNLADGLLGQGLRCLFLLTTNEPIDEVHPALSRPGRCLARIEFGRLSPAEASALGGRPFAAPATLAEVMTAATITSDVTRAAVGQYL
jgi:hypothetical protein